MSMIIRRLKWRCNSEVFIGSRENTLKRAKEISKRLNMPVHIVNAVDNKIESTVDSKDE